MEGDQGQEWGEIEGGSPCHIQNSALGSTSSTWAAQICTNGIECIDSSSLIWQTAVLYKVRT